MIYAGLDEAALGPRLGPFLASLVRFRAEGYSIEADLYELFNGVISRNGRQESLPGVGDSKVIYSTTSGIHRLETGVWTFLSLAGIQIPTTFRDLVGALAPAEDLAVLDSTPWFAESSSCILPGSGADLSAVTGYTENLARRSKDLGIVFEVPSVRIISAKSFNDAIDRWGGKGPAVQKLISPLMYSALSAGDSEPTPVSLIVDRQGGRRYYGEWLAELFPGTPLRALEEGPALSVYQSREQRIVFMVKADDTRLEVALASMVSKYLRETAMGMFNQWWTDRVPGIRPTAGYPLDAKRFIKELDTAGVLPEDPALLIRQR